jgi:hypothetical protein
MTADRAKVVFGGILLLSGIASCATVTLFLMLPLLLLGIDFEWDGPLLDGVIGWAMCPAIIGILFIAIGYSMLTDRRPTPP